MKVKSWVFILFYFFLISYSYSQIIDTIIRFLGNPLAVFYIPTGNKLYVEVVNNENQKFFVIDCSTYEIKKIIPIPSNYPSPAYGLYNWKRDKLYVSFSFSPESIVVIDTKKDTIIKWINFLAYWPWGRCYNSKNDKIYVTNGMNIGVINCENDSLIKIITHPNYWFSHFTSWDSNGNKVYCGCAYSRVVGVIDCEVDSLTKIISLPLIVGNGYCNSFYRKLYVGPHWLGGGIKSAVICTQGDTLVKIFDSLDLDDEIQIIHNRRENKIYWPSSYPRYYYIKVIDCQSDSIIKNIKIVGVFSNMYLAEWSNRLYFVEFYIRKNDYSYNILYVLDCRNDSIISQLKFGKKAYCEYGMTGNPNNKEIYICDMDDSALYVIKDEIVSIKEDIYKNKINISQNIEKPFFDISFLENFKDIEVYDISGKLVLRDKIFLRKIRKGVYIIRDKQKKSIKVIKF